MDDEGLASVDVEERLGDVEDDLVLDFGRDLVFELFEETTE